eukprot:Tbor_TRINITY_DN5812_c0_g1::TRINITY_DN5812_c0_g1_i11::g.6360::m.6360
MSVCCGSFGSRSELMAFITTMSLGFSHLFAYNAILSTPGYFMNFYKYLANDEFAESSYPLFWKNIVACLSVCGFVPCLFTQMIMVTPLGQRFPTLPKMYFG